MWRKQVARSQSQPLELTAPSWVGVQLPNGVVKKAVEKLGRLIANGEYEPNQFIPTEPELQELLGVSRATVRDAVKVLSGKGILQTARHQGTKVRPADEWNLLDFDVIGWHEKNHPRIQRLFRETQEMRYIVEPSAAGLAAERATEDQVMAIMAAAKRLDPDKFAIDQLFAADCIFHGTILDATGSLALRQLRPLVLAMLKLSYEQRLIVNYEKLTHIGHLNVAEAIEQRDPLAARSAMAAMLDPAERPKITKRSSAR